MRWRIMLELAGPDGTPQRHEVSLGERLPTGHTAATLGLSLEEGKAVLAAVQRHLVTAQVDEHCRSRRRCDRCGAQRPLKDQRPRRLISLFGVVEVRAPRFNPCRCGIACQRSVTPVAEIMPDRCTPEYERVVAAMGAALPYRRALALLEAFFPLGDALRSRPRGSGPCRLAPGSSARHWRPLNRPLRYPRRARSRSALTAAT